MPSFVRRSPGGLAACLLLALLPGSLRAQVGTVSGRVTTQGNGVAIAAAQVTIPALNITTLTGADGSYVLTGIRPGTHEVRVARIGFRAASATVQVSAGGVATADIQMVEAALSLDEIVVTGTAGQARRREVGNSIAQVNVSDVKQPVQSLETMLQGREAGLVMPTGRADMGAGQPIRLRGNATLAGTTNAGNDITSYPLIYIDGIRQAGEGYSGVRQGAQPSLLADIDPATIERVEIVKGPAATALYGTEAAAGVIQIFTKRGTPGRTTWTFQTDQGLRWVRPWGSSPGVYERATPGRAANTPAGSGNAASNPIAAGTPTRPCIRLADAGLIAAGLADTLAMSGCHRPYHDMDPYLRKPWRQRYTVSAAGGTDLIRFFVSGSGEGGKGILPNDEDLRYQFRSNLSFHPSSKLNFDVSTAYVRYRFNSTASNNGVESLYFQVVRRPLNGPSTYDYRIIDSILAADINTRTDRMILGATATWLPLKGMSHKFTVGYDDARQEEKFTFPYNFLVDRDGQIGLQKTGSRSLSSDYIMSQQLGLTSQLSITLSAGGQVVQRDQDNTSLEGTGLAGPGDHTVASASSLNAPTITESHVVTGGFLFQNMFAFRDRYFLTVGLRMDGNSAFGRDLGLQAYPKASASYVVSDEAFWPASLGTLKLRGAYGWAGRAPGAFDANRTWTPQLFTGGGGTALIPRNLGNDSLGPEKSEELELGFDASVLNDRLAADFSWYHRTTDDALLGVALPPSLGFSGQQLMNVGKFENKGIELGLTGKVLDGENFGFQIQATMATNSSKVLAVGPARINNVVVGQPAPVVRATKVANAYAFEDPVFVPDSINFYGPNLPTHTFTVAPTVRLPRSITVTARGEYQRGAWITQGAAHFLAQRGPYGTPSCDEVYRHVPWAEYDGPPVYGNVARQRTHPNLDQVMAVDRARCYRTVLQSNLFTWPADFFKLRELTVQAPLPFRLPQTQSAIVTLSARNLFSILSDKNRSNDPDSGGSVEGLTFGYSDAVPAPAEFTFSLRATF